MIAMYNIQNTKRNDRDKTHTAAYQSRCLVKSGAPFS